MEKAVFGLIGAGGIAQSQHLPNLARAPHAHLKTICDLRPDVLAAMQAKYTVPEATTDFQQILADPEIQAVIVATREDQQAPVTITALEAGKHVYVEKPLAETEEACADVLAAQRASGRHVAVGYNRRFAPAYRLAKEILWADGGPRNIHYRISDEYWRWGKNFPPRVRVIHEVCHVFDILRWFTESEVESIYVVESRADDEAYILKFGSGCVATIMNSSYVTLDMPKERVEAVATLGSVTVEEFAELRTFGYAERQPVYRFAGHTHPDRAYLTKPLLESLGADAMFAVRRAGWELRSRVESGQADAEMEGFVRSDAPNYNYMVDKGWIHALDHFAECVATGRIPENAGAEDGLRASQLSHAAIRSRDTGSIVRL